MLSIFITTPALLAPAYRRPALRVGVTQHTGLSLHMSASGSTADYLASTIGPRRSFLDSTDKFDEIAAGAALAGSAAESLGREPGTCDPYDPKSSEFCMDEPEERSDLKRTVRLGVLFFAWYFLNTAYNIGNKLVLTAFPMPWTAATWELFFGFPYVFLLWSTGLRKTPRLSWKSIKLLAPSGVLLAGTHVGGVISFGLGAISFTHVLKATEPVWSALISAAVFREVLLIPVYASLVPILLGVSLASLKELTFSWFSFTAGTLSAVTSAAKAILSKKVLDGKPLGENLTPANMFAILSIIGFCAIAPVTLLPAGSVAEDDEIRRVFNLHDADSSGDIDVAELKIALEALGLGQTTTEQASRVMARYDSDASQKLELDEFRRLVSELRAYHSQRASRS